MWIARRPFRNGGQMVTAGSFVEPAEVHRFTSHLRAGHIIEITEDELPRWEEFFKARYGVDIVPKPKPKTEAKPKAKPKTEAKVASKPAVTAKPVAAKTQPKEAQDTEE